MPCYMKSKTDPFSFYVDTLINTFMVHKIVLLALLLFLTKKKTTKADFLNI